MYKQHYNMQKSLDVNRSSNVDSIKPLADVGDAEPKCMVVFSWALIAMGGQTVDSIDVCMLKLRSSSPGLVMLAGVVAIMGELLLDWSLSNFAPAPGRRSPEKVCQCPQS